MIAKNTASQGTQMRYVHYYLNEWRWGGGGLSATPINPRIDIGLWLTWFIIKHSHSSYNLFVHLELPEAILIKIHSSCNLHKYYNWHCASLYIYFSNCSPNPINFQWISSNLDRIVGTNQIQFPKMSCQLEIHSLYTNLKSKCGR